MPYRKYLALVVFVMCFAFQSKAQRVPLSEVDVTGLWTGFMYNDTTQQNYRYEIAISQNSKGKLFGYSHTYFIVNDKEYHGVKKLKVTREDDEIITEDDELIANNYPIPPAKGVHQQNKLILKLKDTVMILSGLYTTNRTRDFRPLTGYVHVERKNNYTQSALVPHLQELGLAKNLSFLNEPQPNSNAAAEQTLAVLKPMPTAEEELLIVNTAKRQAPQNTIKPTTAPTVVIKTELPKTTEPEVAKVTPPIKKEETPVTKPAIQKPVETTVAKATPPVIKPEPVITKTPPPKQAETVAINKPATPKTEDVVKASPVKPAEVFAPKAAIIKQADPVDPTAATEAGKRKVENIQALYFKSDSLQLTLYDNGEVDGDTVSIIMNGVVIMPRVGLSTNAVKKTIYTKDIGDSIQLVMYAETLGTIPPNTGLLIVYDGNDRYEIRFSGDMQKSSGIVFRRRQ